MFSFVLSVILTSMVVLGPCLFWLSYVTWNDPAPMRRRWAWVYSLLGFVALIAGILHLLS